MRRRSSIIVRDLNSLLRWRTNRTANMASTNASAAAKPTSANIVSRALRRARYSMSGTIAMSSGDDTSTFTPITPPLPPTSDAWSSRSSITPRTVTLGCVTPASDNCSGMRLTATFTGMPPTLIAKPFSVRPITRPASATRSQFTQPEPLDSTSSSSSTGRALGSGAVAFLRHSLATSTTRPPSSDGEPVTATTSPASGIFPSQKTLSPSSSRWRKKLPQPANVTVPETSATPPAESASRIFAETRPCTSSE